jgi:hypothetical protein
MIERLSTYINKILFKIKNQRKDIEDSYGEKWCREAVQELCEWIHRKYSRIWKDNSVLTVYEQRVYSRNTIIETKWYGDDNEKEYRKNPSPLYTTDSVLYKINNSGFRAYNHTGKPKNIIACFGCSNTFGVGLPDEHTWPFILNKKLGFADYKCHNFGISGASNDLIVRHIYNYLNERKNYNEKLKAIVCYLPEIHRIEYYPNYAIEQFPLRLSPRHYPPCTSADHKNYRNFVTTEYAFFNFVKNFKFIETLCKLHNIPLIWHTWSPTLLYFEGTKLRDFIGPNGIYKTDDRLLEINLAPFARDNKHAGFKHNQILAEEFYIRLKSERSFAR